MAAMTSKTPGVDVYIRPTNHSSGRIIVSDLCVDDDRQPNGKAYTYAQVRELLERWETMWAWNMTLEEFLKEQGIE